MNIGLVWKHFRFAVCGFASKLSFVGLTIVVYKHTHSSRFLQQQQYEERWFQRVSLVVVWGLACMLTDWSILCVDSCDIYNLKPPQLYLYVRFISCTRNIQWIFVPLSIMHTLRCREFTMRHRTQRDGQSLSVSCMSVCLLYVFLFSEEMRSDKRWSLS